MSKTLKAKMYSLEIGGGKLAIYSLDAAADIETDSEDLKKLSIAKGDGNSLTFTIWFPVFMTENAAKYTLMRMVSNWMEGSARELDRLAAELCEMPASSVLYNHGRIT